MSLEDLKRIDRALDAAASVLEAYTPGAIAMTRKRGGSPLTEADLAVDEVLRTSLPEPGEGWLSEETADDGSRLDCSRVWIVDPIDGTKEFVEGLPEWCVSIGLAVDGEMVAGGVMNPATGERITGAVGVGVTYDGPTPKSTVTTLSGGRVAASRSEIWRGEWRQFETASFDIVPMGSVAYKTALVAADRMDATWTLCPKNEWDLAGPAALLAAAGSLGVLPDGLRRTWNGSSTRMPGFIAARSEVAGEVRALLNAQGRAHGLAGHGSRASDE